MKQKLMCGLIIAFFVVTGCASMSNRAKCAATGAAVGAAVGATTGAIIGDMGHTHDNRLGGGIIGGVAGALVGGTAGFLICKDDEVIAEPAPQPAPPAPVARPAPQPAPQKIVLNSIQFDFDKSTIKPEFYPMLDAASKTLKQRPATQVAIQGHTDSIGTEAYNRDLSMRRAEAVKAYLVGQGIARENLSVKGFGEANPVANNTTNEGRGMNRRVEFIIN